MPKGVRIFALLAVTVALAACRPLYLPLIPDPPPYESGVRVASFQAEPDSTGRPRLELSLTDLKEAGWLAVQWLAPSGREMASESSWVEPVEEGVTPLTVFVLPDDISLTPGEWRAVVSINGQLLRQFRFEVE